MMRRYSIYFALIALLAAANIGRWWFAAAKADGAGSSHSRIFLPEDFRLRVDSPLALGASRRDLFQPGNVRMAGTAGASHAGSARRLARTVPQPAAPAEPTAAEAAAAELGKVKLLGVVFRGGKGRAYLGLDKENVIALAGETVLGRFAVDKVGEEAVDLRDLKTNTTRRIPVSGK
jgi:hypothetical protein